MTTLSGTHRLLELSDPIDLPLADQEHGIEYAMPTTAFGSDCPVTQ